MNLPEFAEIVKNQFQLCEDVLTDKNEEYATEFDVLWNFRTAASLQGIQMQMALAGMMAKHTISIYDMCWSNEEIEISKWKEKITDHINYLILLMAVVTESKIQDGVDITHEISKFYEMNKENDDA